MRRGSFLFLIPKSLGGAPPKPKKEFLIQFFVEKPQTNRPECYIRHATLNADFPMYYIGNPMYYAGCPKYYAGISMPHVAETETGQAIFANGCGLIFNISANGYVIIKKKT